jgi:hypothetical protein
MQGDGGWGVAGPSEEELEVIEVMDGGSGVRASAAQPPFESFGVGEHKGHNTLPAGRATPCNSRTTPRCNQSRSRPNQMPRTEPQTGRSSLRASATCPSAPTSCPQGRCPGDPARRRSTRRTLPVQGFGPGSARSTCCPIRGGNDDLRQPAGHTQRIARLDAVNRLGDAVTQPVIAAS